MADEVRTLNTFHSFQSAIREPSGETLFYEMELSVRPPERNGTWAESSGTYRVN